MTTVGELRRWLADCERHCAEVNDQAVIYIDDDGLSLCIADVVDADGHPVEVYLEIGGQPSNAPLPLFDEQETPDGKH